MAIDPKETKVLSAIFTAYTAGRFELLFPLMTDDYMHISFWVTDVIRGKEQAQEYYIGKGETIRKSGNLAQGLPMQIVEAPNRVRPNGVFRNGEKVPEDPVFLNRNDAGKKAILMRQRINGGWAYSLVVPTITEDGKLSQLLITEPKNYRLTQLAPDELSAILGPSAVAVGKREERTDDAE